MIKLYEKNLKTYQEIDEEQLELGLDNGTIDVVEIEPSISAETLYNQYKGQKTIINGVYCKIIYDTNEAINPIPAVIKYVKGDNYDN